MKKITIIFACATLIVACKKENNVQPQKQIGATPSPALHDSITEIDYFIHQNLVGNWTRVREYIRGPLLILDHTVTETIIPVTLTYWYNTGNPMTFAHDMVTITNYHRLGSTETWKIMFSSNNAFTLSNYITTGTYNDTQIIDYYNRVP